MSLIILYRNPQRPDEAGMTMIAGPADAGAVIDQLEKRGLIVDKITFTAVGGATPAGMDQLPAAARYRTSGQSSE